MKASKVTSIRCSALPQSPASLRSVNYALPGRTLFPDLPRQESAGSLWPLCCPFSHIEDAIRRTRDYRQICTPEKHLRPFHLLGGGLAVAVRADFVCPFPRDRHSTDHHFHPVPCPGILEHSDDVPMNGHRGRHEHEHAQHCALLSPTCATNSFGGTSPPKSTTSNHPHRNIVEQIDLPMSCTSSSIVPMHILASFNPICSLGGLPREPSRPRTCRWRR